jgi:hypothetical protein
MLRNHKLRKSLFVVFLFLLLQDVWSQPASSNIPLLVIDTYGLSIKDEPKTKAWLKVIDNGLGKVNSITDKATDYEGFIGIEIRGQSSQMFPKKSYGFETRDSSGNDLNTGLLGMPEDSDWILYAPYSDKSLMRNALTYYLGRRLDYEWQPRFRFCELYINDSYTGIYMLVERVKRGEARVNINKLKPDENSGNDLTGGYIIKVDKINGLSDNEYFHTYPSDPADIPGNNEFTYVYPEWDAITSKQKEYIINYIQTIEWSLTNEGFTDPLSGFRKYLDEDSFIDFQLMQELTNNVDGYRYSTFFYKKRDSDGGKVYAGPLWDFDLCYGNVDYSYTNLSTSGWLYKDLGQDGSSRINWWSRMMKDKDYRAKFVERWQELRQGPFSSDSIMSYIDGTVNYLKDPVSRNFLKWPILGMYVWPNEFIGQTYDEEVNYLKTWISGRVRWMDDNISQASAEVEEPYAVPFTIYPNPVSDEINIKFYLQSLSGVNISFYDLMGRKVHSEEYLPADEGNQYIRIKLPLLPDGYYIMNVGQAEQLIGREKVLIIQNR